MKLLEDDVTSSKSNACAKLRVQFFLVSQIFGMSTAAIATDSRAAIKHVCVGW